MKNVKRSILQKTKLKTLHRLDGSSVSMIGDVADVALFETESNNGE